MALHEFIASLADIAERSSRTQLLAVAMYSRQHGQLEFTEGDLKSWLHEGGIPPVKKLKDVLKTLTSGAKAPLLATPQKKYALSVHGVAEIEPYLEAAAGILPAQANLTALVGKITELGQRRFLAEAIACVQVTAKRAAVLMVWSLTLDHLYEFTLKHKLAEFNAALAKRTEKWADGLTITVKDDFAEIPKERIFIELLRAATIVSNDVRKILDEQLGFRNSCGHPSNIDIPKGKVAVCIEDLVENIILKYPL